ncbi:hypothetical protein SAMN03159423_4854 [Bradyrhizobium sp. NFR13]|nr:hypothetical protein SAMN03159423_4854 [Bradyrhizobium sp. NFR13]
MPRKKTDSTLEMWAADLLMEAQAITPCPEHGYMRLRHSHHAVDYALSLAEHRKFSGKNKKERIAAVESVLDGLSDQCPAC